MRSDSFWKHFGCLFLLCVPVVFFTLFNLWKFRDRSGPKSPGGFSVNVHIEDAGWTWSADHYVHIEVTDKAGNAVGRWDDPGGQQSIENVEKLVASMKWSAPDTLEFRTFIDEPVVLTLKPWTG